jgi:crotonobetainyl-CoA:carnitine CoA-transferase CaiB-like acyl-CoA transferase
MRPDPNAGPLDGVRVLDLTGTMSGPFCTLLLAQLGACVDKVEPPEGDVVRHLVEGVAPGMSPIHLSINAGKNSVVLDLRNPADRELFAGALADYDVVVHNMRPSAAARLGLTPEGLTRAGSHAVLCEIVGFGPGPYEALPAYDDTIQATSGMAWVQGNGSRPAYVRTAVADKVTGIYAALAVCAELAGRGRGAGPRSVKVPMYETLVAFTAVEQLGGLTYEPPTGPGLYPRTASPARRPYATSDGYLSVMFYTDRHWAAFFTEIGRPELATDPRFATVAARTANIDTLYGLVEEELGRRTTEDWLKTLERLDVPHARVQALADLLADEHLNAVGMFHVAMHPTEGPVRQARAPFLFAGTPLDPVGLAAALGRDTQRFRARYSGLPGPAIRERE